MNGRDEVGRDEGQDEVGRDEGKDEVGKDEGKEAIGRDEGKDEGALTAQQEAELQAIQSLRGGGALTGTFLSTSSLPAVPMYSQSPLVTAERGVSMRAETEEELTETNDMQEDDEGAVFHRLQKEGSDDSTPSSECVREDHGMMHVKGESTESELDEEEEDEDIIQLREEDEEEEERGATLRPCSRWGGSPTDLWVELSHRLPPQLLPSTPVHHRYVQPVRDSQSEQLSTYYD
ncbi:hypothetical protein F7725_004129 [Dissostichus mawsoni]|uniref:Uncharacterized protein n=1 Tax=Dissostichus mawsoni TaxID=36200 RepID=A0A7J5YDH5_DISMA|nr:hypothetical protein F7725_004129 [Dissostichus mawsoni]